MSTVFYNGVALLRCEELSYERSPVFLGPDYLHTNHVLRVRGVFNPEINPYNLTGPVGFNVGLPSAAIPATPIALGASVPFVTPLANGMGRIAAIGAAGVAGPPLPALGRGPLPPSPVLNRGSPAPITDVSVRHVLMQPRQQLVYAVGTNVLLVAPAANPDGTAAVADAANGPIPLACDVVQVSGNKTFLVDFAISAAVNESYLYVNTPPVLLSHRWTRTEDIDTDMYSTVTTRGFARFRSDRLLFLGVVPDDFRGYLFVPPPPRCQRVAVHVEPSEDGSSIAYTLVDRMTYLRYAIPGVTRVEAFQTVEGEASFLNSLFLGGLGDILNDLGVSGVPRIPLFKLGFVARVWGNPLSTRKLLETVAVGIIGTRASAALTSAFGAAGAVAVALLPGGGVARVPNLRSLVDQNMPVGVREMHDLTGSFVEARLDLVVPPPLTTINIFAAPSVVPLPDWTRFFPAGNDAITTPGGTPLLARDFAPRNDLPDPRYVNVAGTGTRAAYVGSIAAAALGAENVPPGRPGQPLSAYLPVTLEGIPIPP
jgi:hypothetical protein